MAKEANPEDLIALSVNWRILYGAQAVFCTCGCVLHAKYEHAWRAGWFLVEKYLHVCVEHQENTSLNGFRYEAYRTIDGERIASGAFEKEIDCNMRVYGSSSGLDNLK